MSDARSLRFSFDHVSCSSVIFNKTSPVKDPSILNDSFSCWPGVLGSVAPVALGSVATEKSHWLEAFAASRASVFLRTLHGLSVMDSNR